VNLTGHQRCRVAQALYYCPGTTEARNPTANAVAAGPGRAGPQCVFPPEKKGVMESDAAFVHIEYWSERLLRKEQIVFTP
jgi:hypothetical protein